MEKEIIELLLDSLRTFQEETNHKINFIFSKLEELDKKISAKNVEDKAREIMHSHGGCFIGQKELGLNTPLPPIPAIVTKAFLEADCPIFKGDKIATNTALGFDVVSNTWHLIGLKIVPGTLDKYFDEQVNILSECNKIEVHGKTITASSPIHYRPFKAIVDAVIKEQVKAGKDEYPFKGQWARTADTKNAAGGCRVIVGGSSASGAGGTGVSGFYLNWVAKGLVGLAFAWNINKQGEL